MFCMISFFVILMCIKVWILFVSKLSEAVFNSYRIIWLFYIRLEFFFKASWDTDML